jgi:DNA-binding protein HU-beta
MNKGELIDKLADKTGLAKSKAGETIDALLDIIVTSLKKGEEVNLTGFGKFDVQKRKAREGRNPQTGKSIKIPARKAPRFKAGKGLKDSVK